MKIKKIILSGHPEKYEGETDEEFKLRIKLTNGVSEKEIEEIFGKNPVLNHIVEGE